MPRLDEVESRIAELEAREDTALAQVQNLAWLYVVRDHLREKQGTEQSAKDRGVMNDSVDPEAYTSGEQPSEFWTYARKIDGKELFKLLDGFASELEVVYPKAYERLIEILKGGA